MQKTERKLRREKTFIRSLPLKFSRRSRYWATSVLYICVSVVVRHRRPAGTRLSKEKEGEKTETDMQSKAMEGVPVVHTHTTLV